MTISILKPFVEMYDVGPPCGYDAEQLRWIHPYFISGFLSLFSVNRNAFSHIAFAI